MGEVKENQSLERLTENERSYHRRVLSKVQAALATRDSWSEHLAETYKLSNGDSIDADGYIVRSLATAKTISEQH